MSKILIALVRKLSCSTPEIAAFTPCLTTIPASSHFYFLILRPENLEIVLKLVKTSVAAYAVYRKPFLQTFKLLILGFLFILMKFIFKTRMK